MEGRSGLAEARPFGWGWAVSEGRHYEPDRLDLGRRLALVRWGIAVTWSANQRLTAGLVTLSVLAGPLPGATVWVIKNLIDTALSAEGPGAMAALAPWLALALAIAFAEAITPLLHTYLTRRLTEEVSIEVSARVLEHAASLDLSHYEDPEFQDVLMRARQRPAAHFMAFVSESLRLGTRAMEVGALFVAIVYLVPLAGLAFVVLGAIYLPLRRNSVYRHFLLRHQRTTAKRWTVYFTNLVTRRETFPETRVLGLAPLLQQRFRAILEGLRDEDLLHHRRILLISVTFLTAGMATFAALMLYVQQLSAAGALTAGEVTVFIGGFLALYRKAEGFATSLSVLYTEALEVTYLEQFLAARSAGVEESREGSQPPKVVAPAAGALPPPALRLRDVRFTYPRSTHPAVDGISFDVAPGETVGLVGVNGSGKSTLAFLIAGLYRPDAGTIEIDGHDIASLPDREIHRKVALVFQTFTQFEASVGDNIAYGDWRELLGNGEATEQIAHELGLDSFIADLPRGLDTRLGRRFGELDLSKGQWQKVAIARAFAHGGSVILLDEPTSSLDVRGEAEFFAAFNARALGRSAVLISHRFTTLAAADRLVVIDDGRVVESGTHAELLAQDGHYAALYQLSHRQLASVD